MLFENKRFTQLRQCKQVFIKNEKAPIKSAFIPFKTQFANWIYLVPTETLICSYTQ
jgi:hypothetical protein